MLVAADRLALRVDALQQPDGLEELEAIPLAKEHVVEPGPAAFQRSV